MITSLQKNTKPRTILFLMFLPLVSIIFLATLVFAQTLSVTCEAGGPYGTNSAIVITGNVTNQTGTSEANVTVDIRKSGTLRTTKNVSADSSGKYYAIFTGLDYGDYTVNITATQKSTTAECSDSLLVRLGGISTSCNDFLIRVWGRALYSSGSAITSGTVYATVKDTFFKNSTTFSNGNFSIYLDSCLFITEKYILQLSVTDTVGRKGTSEIIFSPT